MHLELRFKQTPEKGSSSLGQVPGWVGSYRQDGNTIQIEGVETDPKAVFPVPPEITPRYCTWGPSTERLIEMQGGVL